MSKLLLASPRAGVGKTTAAINLAAAAALAGRRVLLADCDPAGGAIHDLGLGLPTATLAAVGVESPAPLWRDVVPGLDVTSPYGDPQRPAHTLDEFLALVSTEPGFRTYSAIVFDTPPVLAGSQVAALLRSVDDAVLVVRAEPAAFREVSPFLHQVKRAQDEGAAVQLRGLLLTLPAGEAVGGSWETELRRAFATSLLPQTVPHDPAAPTRGGRPAVSADPSAPAARQYAALAYQLGLVDADEEAVELFRPPSVERGQPNTEPFRDQLDPDVRDVLDNLSQVVRPVVPNKHAAARPASETRTMSSPDPSVPDPTPPTSPTRGHTGDVTGVAYSPDGRTLATASWDKTVRLWDAATGQERAALGPHGGVVSAVAFSPDGQWIATASWDKTARIWKSATGELAATLKGHGGVVTSVAFSAVGDLVATGGWDKSVRLWRTDGTPVGVLTGHVRMVTSVAIAPDGRAIVSGSWDRTLKRWDPATGACIATLGGHAGDVTSVACSPDGKTIASGSLDHTIRFWDVASGREVNVLRGHGGEVTCVTFSPDGRTLASAGWDRVVKVWDVQTGQVLASMTGHAGVVTAVAFSPDGRRLASSSLDRVVKVWDLGTGMESGMLRVQSSNDARSAGSFNPRETPPPKGPSPDETTISSPPQAPTPVPSSIPRAPLPSPAVQPTRPLPPVAERPEPAPLIARTPTPPMVRRPAPPVPMQPDPIPTPSPAEDDSFVETWSGPPGLPLLEDVLGPSVGPKPFGGMPSPTRVVPSGVRPVMVPVSQPPGPPGVPKALRFGDLAPPTATRAAEPEPEEAVQPFAEVSLPDIHLPDMPATVRTIAPTVRLADLQTNDVGPTPASPVQLPEVQVVGVNLSPAGEVVSEVEAGAGDGLSGQEMVVHMPGLDVPSAPQLWVQIPDSSEPATAGEGPDVTVFEFTVPPNSDTSDPRHAVEIRLPDLALPSKSLPDADSPENLPVAEDVLGPSDVPLDMAPGDATDIDLPHHAATATAAEDMRDAVPSSYSMPDQEPHGQLPMAETVQLADEIRIALPAHLPVVRSDMAEVSQTPVAAPIELAHPVAEPLRPAIALPDLAVPPDAIPIDAVAAAQSETRPQIVPTAARSGPVPNQPWRARSFGALAVSPDGAHVAAAAGSTVHIWNAMTGDRLPALRGQPGEVAALAFSTDGAVLATVGSDGVVHVWEVANGTEFRSLPAEAGQLAAVAFSPDDLHVAAGGSGGIIRVWDWVSGEHGADLIATGEDVTALAYSPDGLAVVSGGGTGTVRLWDLEDRTERLHLRAHVRAVTAVAYAADGERFASAGGGGLVKVWDAGTGEEWLAVPAHPGGCSSVAFGPGGDLLVTGGSDNSIRMWNANNGHPIRALAGHTGEITGLAFTPDGRTLISAGADQKVRLWDTFAGTESGTLTERGLQTRAARPQAPRPAPIRATVPAVPPPPAAPLPPPVVSVRTPEPAPTIQVPIVPFQMNTNDSFLLVTAGGDSAVRIWSPSSRAELRTLAGHGREATCLAVSPDGRWILTGGDDEMVRLWDPTTGTERFRFAGHSGEITAVAFSPDGRTLASTSADMCVKLWDLPTGAERATLIAHRTEVLAIAFTPDGKTLATGGRDGTTKLWDVMSLAERRTLRGHTKLVKSLAFSPDGRQLLSGSWDWTAKLWDLSTGQAVQTFSGHGAALSSVAFLPAGRGVVTASWDKTARLWSLAGGQSVRTLEGHTDRLSSVAVSPDGSVVATASWDGTTTLWDSDTGRETTKLKSPAGRLQAVAFMPAVGR